MKLSLAVASIAVSTLVCFAHAEQYVASIDALRTALAKATPGDKIVIAPGTYRGFDAANLRGSKEKPIVLAAAQPNEPPVFTSMVHLSDIAYVELEGLIIRGAQGNGLNIDDGGTHDTPSEHVTLRSLRVENIGGRGNEDGIKLSGVVDFTIERSTIVAWGRGGSGIDMVGCQRGRIVDCTLRDSEEGSASNGIQAKGGSRDIIIRTCRFEHAGQRAINIGGSTGRAFFRPAVQGFEAKDITVEGCTFIGSLAPIAFVGVDGAIVQKNTFYRPRKWLVRILQESRDADFLPCRNGRFVENLIAYRRDELVTAANVGPGTAPETFTFEKNYWWAIDAGSVDPARSILAFPTPERSATGGRDPGFRDAEKGQLDVSESSPAKDVGAHAFKRVS